MGVPARGRVDQEEGKPGSVKTSDRRGEEGSFAYLSLSKKMLSISQYQGNIVLPGYS